MCLSGSCVPSCVCPAPRRRAQLFVSASFMLTSFSKLLCFMDEISCLCERILMSLRSSVPWRAFCKSWVHPYCCPFHGACPRLSLPLPTVPLQSVPQLARPPVCPSPAGHPPPARPRAGLSLTPALEWRRGSLWLGSRGISFLLGSRTQTPGLSPGPGPRPLGPAPAFVCPLHNRSSRPVEFWGEMVV